MSAWKSAVFAVETGLQEPHSLMLLVGWLLACLTSQEHARVFQGRISSDKWTCCHTAAHPTVYLTQSQYTDTRPTSPRTDPMSPGAWQGSHRSASSAVEVYGFIEPPSVNIIIMASAPIGVTRPDRNAHGACGNRTPDLPFPRWTPYLSANEAVPAVPAAPRG